MKQFVFYLDDDTKEAVLQKLKEDGVQAQKGAIAATIRVLLRAYADGAVELSPEQIEQEYTYTTKKNKRSKM